MKTAGNQVKAAAKQPRSFYTLDELKEFISGKSKVKLLEHEDFKQHDGYLCKFVFEGGFYIPYYPPRNPELNCGGPYLKANLYSILYEDLPRELVLHYSNLWEKIRKIFGGFLAYYCVQSNSGDCSKLEFHPYDKVVFGFIYNGERSLDSYKNIFTEWLERTEWHIDDWEIYSVNICEPSDAIRTLTSYYILYDLFVEAYKDGVFCQDCPSQIIKGIPHFAIPSILKFIGECLSQALPMPKSNN